MMPALMAAAAVALAAGLVAWRLFDRWRTLSLRWPEPINRNGVMRRMKRYLEHSGWKVDGHPEETWISIRKGRTTLRVGARGSEQMVAPVTFEDMRMRRLAGGKYVQEHMQILLVTAREVDPVQRGWARDNFVIFLHYSELRDLDRIVAEETARFAADRERMRPKELRAKEVDQG